MPLSALLNALLIATVGMVAESPAAPPELRPIRLQEEQFTGGVHILVIGASPSELRAQYRLEVTSGPNGNRSIQTGSAVIRPGSEVLLINLRMAGSGSGWSARLTVTPESGAPYEDRLDGSATEQ